MTLLFEEGVAVTVEGEFTRKVLSSGSAPRFTVPEVVETVKDKLVGGEFGGAGRVEGKVQAFETTALLVGKTTAPNA